jgi:hypothetical protein
MHVKVVDTFAMLNGDTVVVVDAATQLPAGVRLNALIRRPDGAELQAHAFREVPRLTATATNQGEAYRLVTLAEHEITKGSSIEFTVAKVLES